MDLNVTKWVRSSVSELAQIGPQGCKLVKICPLCCKCAQMGSNEPTLAHMVGRRDNRSVTELSFAHISTKLGHFLEHHFWGQTAPKENLEQ